MRFGLGPKRRRLTLQFRLKAPKPTSAPTTQPGEPAEPPKKGKSYTLIVGEKTGKDEDEAYAAIGGEPTVFTVAASLLDDLQPKIVDLRNKQVLEVDTPDVSAVEIALEGESAKLAKVEGQWQMTAPVAGRASKDAVSELLDKIDDLKAEAFRDDVTSLARLGLETPAATITLHLAGKDQRVSLLVGAKSPSGEFTYVKRAAGKSAAAVPSDDVKPLLQGAATYWDRELLKLAPKAKIQKIGLTRTDGQFTLERDKEDAWALTAPLATKADGTRVNDIIDHLKDLKATKVVSIGPAVPQKYAKAKDAVKVVFTTTRQVEVASQPASASAPATQPTSATAPAKKSFKEVKEEHVLQVVKVDDHAYAWGKAGKIVAVGEFALKLHDDLTAELRDRQIWSIEADDVETLKVVVGKKTLQLERQEETWEYTIDALVKIDAEKIEDYLKDVKEITAERFTTHGPADPAKFGLNAPDVTLEIKTKDAKTRVIISKMGPKDSKDRYAMADGVKGVFVLSEDTLSKISKTLEDVKK